MVRPQSPASLRDAEPAIIARPASHRPRPLAEERPPEAPSVRHRIQRWIQRTHHSFLDRGMPTKVALYYHAMEAHQRPAFMLAVRMLLSEGYTPVASPDEHLRDPEERTLWISFDDSYRSWYESRGLFDALGIRATFYTNSGVFRDRASGEEIEAYFDRLRFAGERIPLSVAELRALRSDGHVIAAHTHTHPNLGAISPEAAAEEMRLGRDGLEEVLGESIRHFSYPFGMRRNFPARLLGVAADLGFETVARAIPAMQHAPNETASGGGPRLIHRHGWRDDRSLYQNLRDLCTDGRAFERLTGRSAVG
ncbi:MAG: polysaccharide deacetylase family protein [Bacteroidota bacterium]